MVVRSCVWGSMLSAQHKWLMARKRSGEEIYCKWLYYGTKIGLFIPRRTACVHIFNALCVNPAEGIAANCRHTLPALHVKYIMSLFAALIERDKKDAGATDRGEFLLQGYREVHVSGSD
jgi:hypothetical protein